MNGEDWRNIGEVAGYLLIGSYIAYKAHRAEQQAKKAKEYSEPTGNGFAKNVKDALVCLQVSAAEQKNATERIELRQAQDSTMLYDHIKAHANADVLKGALREPPSETNAS